tara:strand:+ start:80 stop:664 length:585 start_codon:yes stop_codon:yes gene_type:complete
MGMSISTGIKFCWEVSEEDWERSHRLTHTDDVEYYFEEPSFRELIIKAVEECEAKAEENEEYWEIEIEHLNTDEEIVLLSIDTSGGTGTYGEEVGIVEPKVMVSSERSFLKHDEETKEHLLYILNAPVRHLNADREEYLNSFDEDINSYADEEEMEEFRKEHSKECEDSYFLYEPLTAKDIPEFMKWRLYGSVC